MEVEPMEETDSLASALPGEEEGSADDPNRRRLRQRSIVEGGYARLHMGLEEEEEDKKNLAPPPHPTPAKVTPETWLHALTRETWLHGVA